VFALWEHENAYTDSLGTFQPSRNFETGRASAGIKAIYPAAWTWGPAVLSPYAGLYADYYFSQDDAQTVGLTTVPLLQGWSARATGGVAASFAGGATLGAGGEFGGLGSPNHIWTWTARGRILSRKGRGRFIHGFANTPPVSACGAPVVPGNVSGSPRRLRTAR
jgi:Autotransporter beta-domain